MSDVEAVKKQAKTTDEIIEQDWLPKELTDKEFLEFRKQRWIPEDVVLPLIADLKKEHKEVMEKTLKAYDTCYVAKQELDGKCQELERQIADLKKQRKELLGNKPQGKGKTKIVILGSCKNAPYEVLLMPNPFDKKLYAEDHEKAYKEAAELFYPAIDNANVVFVYAPNGIGEHTRKDLDYAKSKGKLIAIGSREQMELEGRLNKAAEKIEKVFRQWRSKFDDKITEDNTVFLWFQSEVLAVLLKEGLVGKEGGKTENEKRTV